MANSVYPDQTASILNLSVILGNYLQQTNSADDFSRRHFQMHLGALRVNMSTLCW